uniref:Integrase catalytic domain-containing protein n=1 Tax=Trichuris muris TaxID=70415 RepID=A0A5S6QHB5_TRIMR
MEAEATAELLMCRFFAKFGPPDSVHSDQGRTFEASLMKELWQVFGIQKTRTTPYHPQSNGLVERVNRTLLDVLQALDSEAFEVWDRILPMVTLAYNASVHEATGTTPYFAMFGREARLPVDIYCGVSKPTPTHLSDYIWKSREQLQEVHSFMRRNMKPEQRRRKEYHDRKTHAPGYKPSLDGVHPNSWRTNQLSAKKCLQCCINKRPAQQFPFAEERMLRRLFYRFWYRAKPEQLTDEQLAVCLAEFAWKLYKLEPEQNVLFSPASVFLALSMLHVGAEGKTKQQINDVLFGKQLNLSEVETSIRTLMNALKSTDEEYTKIVWKLANRLYVSTGFKILPAYQKELEKLLSSEVVDLDFTKGSAACDEVNRWVSKQTNEKIVRILDTVGDSTLLVVINAVYFKGAWDKEFFEGSTALGSFYRKEDDVVELPMMKQTSHEFYYNETAEWQVLGMPYAAKYLRMYIILPRERSSLSKVEKTLSGKTMLDALSGAREEEVQVTIPKFKFEMQTCLDASLTKLGMTDVFDQFKANFSRVSDKEHLFVSTVLHKTFIDVDEKGTEAAGATAIKVALLSARINERRYVFTADHPFLFAIVDMRFKAVLFLGRFTGY